MSLLFQQILHTGEVNAEVINATHAFSQYSSVGKEIYTPIKLFQTHLLSLSNRY